MFDRSSGILMHISSLPGEYGIGDFGKGAYEFVDFLEKSGQKLWQILPLGPTGFGDSPYQCYSAFAGNFLFIDPKELAEKNYISFEELEGLKNDNNKGKVDYSGVHIKKETILRKAFEVFSKRVKEDGELKSKFEKFESENSFWLENYALYMALKIKFSGMPWNRWSKDYRRRDIKKIELNEKDKENFNYFKFIQFIFYTQWYRLKDYANSKGIKIIGDIPIFVATDSADTWEYSNLFQFTKSKRVKKVAGCPPDYFSKTGQLWGNVLYNWRELEKTGYRWWIERIRFSFNIYDIVRIDHFRGFEAYWSIRAGKKTAIKGKWEKGPGMKLFRAIEKELGELPIIVEDLGFLTPQVERLLRRSGYPGMRILQFAFGDDENKYLPHKYIENCVAYSGTHDNDTIVGWYESLDSGTKYRCDEYLKQWLTPRGRNFWDPINWRVIETLWSSVANMVLVQMQDLLGLESDARMNTPATVGENWRWRMDESALTDDTAARLREVTKSFNR